MTIVVARNQVEVTIAVNIAQHHRGGAVYIGCHIHAAHAIEGISRAVVQIQTIGLIVIASNQVQVAVAVHVVQGYREGAAGIGCHIHTAHAIEGVSRTVVQVQAVGLAAVPGNQVQVAVAIHVTQSQVSGGVGVCGQVHAAHPIEGIGRAVVQV